MIKLSWSRLFIVSLLLVSFACSTQRTQAPLPLEPLPSAAQMAWHEMEMNAFIHFTTNTFTDKEWGYGDENPAVFNPTALDTDQWISTLQAAGFKGVILTCKHHDGFCLWPSQYTDHSVKESPFQKGEADIVKSVSESCQKYGMKFGIYVSPWDRNRADYGQPSYITYYRNQLKELFTNYGPVFEMWFDGANGGDGYYGGAREKREIDRSTYYDWPNTLDSVRKMQSDVIFFSDAGPGVRWSGNEAGIGGETNWNMLSPDTVYAGKANIEKLLNSGSETGTHWIPAEVNTSIRPGWFYHEKEDSMVKTPEQLFDIYLTSVGRGSTLLLNVPPDRRGLLHENDVRALKEWRTLIDQTFATDLAQDAIVKSDTYRGNDTQYHADKLIDKDVKTFWATDDDTKTGSITLELSESKLIKYVVLQEPIQLGQRVKSFTISVWKNGQWQEAANGNTIGYKRIMKIEPTTTTQVRITINDARACPLLSTVALY
ncbi:MAG: glycoside hydrolase family 29 [Cytophagia bacterium]|nr:glycoside hydrolase family 29 [Cytophagia bacterium]